MTIQLKEKLKEAEKNDALPEVIAYNRIDGPGSSLDLREFQQSLWSYTKIPTNLSSDPTMEWSKKLPRTIGITIDTGTSIKAKPLGDHDSIGIQSEDYGTENIAKHGKVIPTKENWLLKIIELFNLSGVEFVTKNLCEGILSSGLGGSATVTIGVCILANELAEKPFSEVQLISIASRMEQDLGVSITGTQEQANVIYGGIKDYIWFPWGRPSHPESQYGDSIRTELLKSSEYKELEQRMAIFHTGRQRGSTDVNKIWRQQLQTTIGYKLHLKKPLFAYKFREGIRLKKWDQVFESIMEYCKIRETLCPKYLEGSKEIIEKAKSKKCAIFPMGAGGGGGVLAFSPYPKSLQSLREEIKDKYQEIRFKIKSKGHETKHLPIS